MKKMRIGIASSLMLKVTGIGLGFCLHLVAARTLGKAGYGDFAYNLSLAILLSVVARVSFDLSLVRLIAEHKERNEYGLIKGLIIWSILVTTVLSLLICVVLSLVVGNYIQFNCYIFPLFICIAMTMIAQGLLRSYGETIRAFSPDMVGRPLISILGVLLLFSLQGGITVDQALFMQGMAAMCMLYFSWNMVNFICPDAVQNSTAMFDMKKWSSISAPIFLSNFVSVVEIQLVVILAGIFLSSSETATISICLRLAAMATITTVAVNMYIAPILARNATNNDELALRQAIDKASKIMLIPIVPVVIVCYQYGDWLLLVIGPEYEDGWLMLNVFVIGRLAAALFGPVILIMQMTGSETESVLITMLSVLLFIVTSVVSIPLYGAIGLVSCFTSAVVIRQMLGVMYLKKKMNICCGIFTLASRQVIE